MAEETESTLTRNKDGSMTRTNRHGTLTMELILEHDEKEPPEGLTPEVADTIQVLEQAEPPATQAEGLTPEVADTIQVLEQAEPPATQAEGLTPERDTAIQFLKQIGKEPPGSVAEQEAAIDAALKAESDRIKEKSKLGEFFHEAASGLFDTGKGRFFGEDVVDPLPISRGAAIIAGSVGVPILANQYLPKGTHPAVRGLVSFGASGVGTVMGAVSPEVIGEITVISIQEDTATGVILNAVEPIFPGHKVRSKH